VKSVFCLEIFGKRLFKIIWIAKQQSKEKRRSFQKMYNVSRFDYYFYFTFLAKNCFFFRKITRSWYCETLKGRDLKELIITEAKSVIRLPKLTGAIRSAPLGESYLFQDSLEEAIKIQKNLDPIPAKRVSWPDKAKKQTRHSLPTQVGTTRETSLG
jgi:hypothetical protein